ncbi:MAG: ATP-binding protein [Acidobacteriota bacterium]|nr:ATP-binding protein [Acidobacteriota bacterium]
MASRRRGVTHDQRILLMALAAAAPGAVISLIFLWTGDYTPKVQWTLTVFIVFVCLGFAFALRERVVLPLQTLSNLLAALAEGDYSIRARGARDGDPLGEVMTEVNALVDLLRHQRMYAVDATNLLHAAMEEIEVAVFTFDPDRRLTFVNRAGENLLQQPVDRMLGKTAADLGLTMCFTDEHTRVLNASFPGGAGRWELRRSSFRQDGRPHEMIALSDVSRPLREEERQAWQRLIRVIGHELNNSLAPIKSIAGSLALVVRKDPPPPDWREDVDRGLAVIAGRAESLSRFMSAYARLAKLPQPSLRPVDLGAVVQRVVSLERRAQVAIRPGPPVAINADIDQMEQLLINLVRNAVEAAAETGGRVTVNWRETESGMVELFVDDSGPGLSNTGNLFVPFFTTKQGGSGIGLVLSRQIAEAHGGTLSLENRDPEPGCRATLRMPLAAA